MSDPGGVLSRRRGHRASGYVFLFRVQHRWLGEVPLTPTAEDTFSGEDPIGELECTRNEAGHVTGLSVSAFRTRGVRFDKRE